MTLPSPLRWTPSPALIKPALIGLSAVLALALCWVPGSELKAHWYESTTYFLLVVTFLLWVQTVLPGRGDHRLRERLG